MNDLAPFLPKKSISQKENTGTTKISIELQKEIIRARTSYTAEAYKIEKAVFHSKRTFCGYSEVDVK